MATILRTVAQGIRGKLVCVLILAISFSLNAQVSKEDMLKSIKIDKLQHPYLFFTNAEKPTMLKRIQSNPESKDVWAALLQKGHRWMYFRLRDPAPLPPKHPRYAASGNDYANWLSAV